MPGALVPSVILSGAADKILACGRKPSIIAKQAGLPAAALRDPDLLINGRDVMTFFDLAARACRRRNLGLEIAADARLAAVIGPLWVLLRHARTIREFCTDLARNYDVYTSAALMRFEPAGRGGWLGWSAAAGYAPNEVQVAEFALGVLVGEIRSHAAPGWMPGQVLFRHESPRDLRLHRRLFGSRLRFNADRNAFEIDAATLDRPLLGGVPGGRALARRVVRLHADVPTTAIAPQVESVLRALLPYAPSSLVEVSRALGMPSRTLQACLQADGHSFRAIKDAVRRDLAHKYLRHSAMSATEIADLLGYADLTSFSRSFRRWHGTSVRRSRR